jgi:hypothetical protein
MDMPPPDAAAYSAHVRLTNSELAVEDGLPFASRVAVENLLHILLGKLSYWVLRPKDRAESVPSFLVHVGYIFELRAGP